MHAGYTERHAADCLVSETVAAADCEGGACALVLSIGGVIMDIRSRTGGGGQGAVCDEPAAVALSRTHCLNAVRAYNGGVGKRDEAVKALGDLS